MTVSPPLAFSSAPIANAVFELSAGPYAPGELRVVSFDGREEMNGSSAAFFLTLLAATLANVWPVTATPGGLAHRAELAVDSCVTPALRDARAAARAATATATGAGFWNGPPAGMCWG